MDEIPFGNQFEQAVSSFTRNQRHKLKGKAIESIKEMLASGTEPFFRIGMGERHFGDKERASAYSLWAIGLLIHLGSFAILPKWYAGLGSLVALGVLIKFTLLSRDNETELNKIRAEKQAYHTRSPGRPRYNPGEEKSVRIVASVGLLLTAPVVGIAFIASMATSRRLASEQAQKIYNNYLDSRDNEIEAKFMERALKGEIPAEVTYLYAPLSAKKYDEETREDIARAWVAGTPKSLARPPEPTIVPSQAQERPAPAAYQQPDPKPAQPATQTPITHTSKPATDWEEKERDFVAENPPELAQKSVLEASKPEASNPPEQVLTSKTVKRAKRSPSENVEIEVVIDEESFETPVRFECDGKIAIHPLWHVINNYIAKGKEISHASIPSSINGSVNGTKAFMNIEYVIQHFAKTKKQV